MNKYTKKQLRTIQAISIISMVVGIILLIIRYVL